MSVGACCHPTRGGGFDDDGDRTRRCRCRGARRRRRRFHGTCSSIARCDSRSWASARAHEARVSRRLLCGAHQQRGANQHNRDRQRTYQDGTGRHHTEVVARLRARDGFSDRRVRQRRELLEIIANGLIGIQADFACIGANESARRTAAAESRRCRCARWRPAHAAVPGWSGRPSRATVACLPVTSEVALQYPLPRAPTPSKSIPP